MFKITFTMGVNIEDFVQEVRGELCNPTSEEAIVLEMMQLLISEYVNLQKELRDERTDGQFQWKDNYPYATVNRSYSYLGELNKINSYSLSKDNAEVLKVELSYYVEDTNDLCLSVYYNGDKAIHYCFTNVY